MFLNPGQGIFIFYTGDTARPPALLPISMGLEGFSMFLLVPIILFPPLSSLDHKQIIGRPPTVATVTNYL